MSQKKLFETVEDQAVADAEHCLTDEQLTAGGMRSKRCWVKTDASKGALRVKKHREKLEKEGLKQISIKVPIEQHETIKQISSALVEGKTILDAIIQVVPAIAPKVERALDPVQLAVLKALIVGGWRAKTIRWMAGWLVGC